MTSQKSGEAEGLAWRRLIPLVLGAFTVAVEGTVLTGVLPALSTSLSVSASTVGQVLAMYPVIYVVASPLLALVVRSRRACTFGLVVFAAGNLISASAQSITPLALGRLVSAAGAALFIPNAGAQAVALGKNRKGRALAVMSSGFTAATLAGAPLGVYVASHLGWRWVLVVVAAMAVVVAAFQRADAPVSGMSIRDRFRFLGDRRMLAIVLLTAAVVAGEFVVYAYISLLVNDIALAMLVFGIGTTAGTLLGGFGVDRFGWSRMLAVSLAVTVCAMVSIPFIGIVGLAVWGVFGWMFTPAQANRLLTVFPDNGAMVLTLNSSAVQIGVAAGGFAGGIVLNVASPTALPFVGAATVLVAAVVSRRVV
ncbi:MFS transporter [Kibdelosporangium aridum]|uniref:MFS transporter n=1 Tax=Kibdelosporangium aridum TaxID=2030 RepID=UPI0035E85D2C